MGDLDISIMEEKLQQSSDLIQILREENNRLEDSSNDLVHELQNAIYLSKSLNEECELLREQNQHLTGLASAGGGKGLTEELENSILEKNQNINYLKGLLHQSKTSHEKSIQNMKMLEEKIQDKVFEAKVLTDEVAMLHELVDTLNNNKDDLLSKIDDYRVETKRITGQLTQLQGNIRVLCRIKSQLVSSERNSNGDEERDEAKYTYDVENIKYKKHIYEYDRVFEPFVSQEEVFEEVEAMIRSAMFGYHSCIISYGGNETGKSYTLFGETGDWGIILRTFKTFLNLSRMDSGNITTQVSLSMVEIWNEEIYDLLGYGQDKSITVRDTIKYDKASIFERSKTSKKSLDLRTFKHHCVVENLSEWMADQIEEIEALINFGLRNKHNIGDRLCKSHVYVVAKVKRTNRKTGATSVGSVRFADLAGSDKVVISTPGLTSIDLKESQYINRGLTALSEIISALASRLKFTQTSIPYRMSKLTALMQESVREHRQVVVITHVAPEQETEENLKNTLDFGIKCKTVQLKRPDRNDPV